MTAKWCIRLVAAILYLMAQVATAQTPAPTATPNGATPLDTRLKLNSDDEVSPVFDGVVAVQRKAKVKGGSWLVNPTISFDFSDAPYTQRSLQLNLGYAFGESWEVYLAYAPFFIAEERNLAKQVKQRGFAIDAEKPRSFMGIEANWVPIYGKDSWGPYYIVRSDTYIHFSYGQIQYEKNNGNRIKLALGKTFFFSDRFNLRVQAGPSIVETFSTPLGATSAKREEITIGLIETGLVFYF